MAPQALDDVPVSDATARPAEPATVSSRRRRPNLAASLSVIPGGGQLYNGQPRKAAVFFVATLATIGAVKFLCPRLDKLGFAYERLYRARTQAVGSGQWAVRKT